MKQHITIEQLRELSEEGSKRLLVWILSKKYSFNGPSLLSIGRMIEFLYEEFVSVKLLNNSAVVINNGWGSKQYTGGTGCRVTVVTNDSLTHFSVKDYPFKHELCDALWEAVKEVLNETN